MLYLFVAIGLMDKYEIYPATPRIRKRLTALAAVILFLLSLGMFLALGAAVRRFAGNLPAPGFKL